MHIPTVVDVLYLWIARVEVFKPLRKLGSSRQKIIKEFTRLKLTEVADSYERQQERYIYQRQNIIR